MTHIQQVEENYDLLREAMTSGAEPNQTDELIAPSRSKVNYGEPFADALEEVKVAELVELFTEFRLAVSPAQQIHSSRTWRWAKSFRIMLGHHRRNFAEAKMVVTALRDYPEMDRARYTDPFDMYQRGEWGHLVAAARLAQLRAERQRPADTWHCRHDTQQGASSDWESSELEAGEPRFLDMSARKLRPLNYYSQNYANDS